MSKVQRFWCHDASNIRCVRESDYDAAQSELAALREELANTTRVAITEIEGLSRTLQDQAKWMAIYSDLLGEVLSEVPHGWGESFTDSDLAERIRQAIKPTESGASE